MKTKIYLFLLLVFCIQPCVLKAEGPGKANYNLLRDDDDEKMYKGLRFGWQQSQLSESDWDPLSSFYAGIFAARKLGVSKFLSIYTGLEYYETGSRENDKNIIKLSYISLPLNLRVKLGPAYAFGGVNPSFKIADKVKVLGVDVSDEADISGFDMGGQLGVGAKLAFIGIELKYNVGFIQVIDDNTTSHLQAGLCLYF